MGKDCAGVTCADDGDTTSSWPILLAGGTHGFPHGTQGETHAGQTDEEKDEVESNHPAGRSETSAPDYPDASEHETADCKGVKHAGQVRCTEVAEQRV